MIPAVGRAPLEAGNDLASAPTLSRLENSVSKKDIYRLTEPTAEALYRDRYCAQGQDENFIKAIKNDLASDHTSVHAFLANHLRLFYSCAAYVLIHSLRENTLVHTELAKAQPMSIILKLFKLAVRVVQYKDRIKLSLPGACPMKGVLARVTELLYLVPRPPAPA
jgi:hypothetical protein